MTYHRLSGYVALDGREVPTVLVAPDGTVTYLAFCDQCGVLVADEERHELYTHGRGV